MPKKKFTKLYSLALIRQQVYEKGKYELKPDMFLKIDLVSQPSYIGKVN